MITSLEEIIIYESPDGGKTVYSRKSGSIDKKLILQDKEGKQMARWVALKEAIMLAETNATLNDAITQVEMIYQLLKENEE